MKLTKTAMTSGKTHNTDSYSAARNSILTFCLRQSQ